jgi:hypothetical protein
MKKRLFAVLAASLLIGCGGGGGGGSSAPTQPQNPSLSGTYSLMSAELFRWNGTVWVKQPLPAMTGSFEIGQTSVKFELSAVGVATFKYVGAYTVTWDSQTNGVLYLTGPTGIKEDWDIIFQSGVLAMDLGSTWSNDGYWFDEHYYWKKVSESYTILAPEVEKPETNQVELLEGILERQ